MPFVDYSYLGKMWNMNHYEISNHAKNMDSLVKLYKRKLKEFLSLITRVYEQRSAISNVWGQDIITRSRNVKTGKLYSIT